MGEDRSALKILIAEDDEDDYLLTQDALAEARILGEVYRVRDGEELMDYLMRRGPYADPKQSPRPGIVLLDLNMPRKDGREALKEIKGHPDLKRIPVIILTTSETEEDIRRAYELGVSSFIRKPITFEGFVKTFRMLKQYWFEVVALPDG